MREMLQKICDNLNRPLAMVTIADHKGSTPRVSGSKMLVGEDGLIFGTVGGGLGEALAIKKARETIKNSQSALMQIDMTGELKAGADLICGGKLNLFIEYLEPNEANKDFFSQLLTRLNNGRNSLIIVNVKDSSQRFILDRNDNSALDTALAEAAFRKIFAKFKTQLFFFRNEEYFLEPYQAPVNLIIAGGGHVSLPTAQMSAMAGFRVTILDDRAEFVAPSRFPWLDPSRLKHTPGFGNCFSPEVTQITPQANTFIAIMTRGHAFDYEVLSQALTTKAGYIGMIGSKRKRHEIYNMLMTKGFKEADFKRITSPIGLAIQAETPEEIAVSILAQLIEVRAGIIEKIKPGQAKTTAAAVIADIPAGLGEEAASFGFDILCGFFLD